MGSASVLSDLLDTILAAALAALDETRTGHPAPARALVTAGPPAVDVCEGGLLAAYLDLGGLTPHYLQARVAPGDLPTGRCAVTTFAHVAIECWRCYPTLDDLGNPPAVSVEAAAAAGLALDAWCLYTGILSGALAGSIVPGAPCDTIMLSPLEPLEPSGGAAGIKLPLAIQLSGAGPA